MIKIKGTVLNNMIYGTLNQPIKNDGKYIRMLGFFQKFFEDGLSQVIMNTG